MSMEQSPVEDEDTHANTGYLTERGEGERSGLQHHAVCLFSEY